MLMCLGLFVWSINTLAYQELNRQTDWRFASNNRVGKRPASQFVGQGSDKITLSGWIAPELAGERVSLEVLRLMADQGTPYVLVGGTGRVFGLWEIHSISEGGTLFHKNGLARRIEFSVVLNRVDDEQIDQVGLITNIAELL